MPLPIASSRYFIEVNEAVRLNLMLLELVMSVNVTGDCACGTDGADLFAGTAELYDLPVRAGVGEGVEDGCWEKTVTAVSSRKDRNNNIKNLPRSPKRGQAPLPD